MAESKFIYVTYIRTTPKKLWQALIDPAFTRRYWFGTAQESKWKQGASWTMKFPDGRVADTGKVLKVDPKKKLVLKWRNEFKPELKAEGYTKMTCTLEKQGTLVKLTIVHAMPKRASKFIAAAATGWPMILSSLKSLLETGEGLRYPAA